MVESEMLRKAGVREVERDESESLRFDFLFLSFHTDRRRSEERRLSVWGRPYR